MQDALERNEIFCLSRRKSIIRVNTESVYAKQRTWYKYWLWTVLSFETLQDTTRAVKPHRDLNSEIVTAHLVSALSVICTKAFLQSKFSRGQRGEFLILEFGKRLQEPSFDYTDSRFYKKEDDMKYGRKVEG
uniref:Uncharacterized protein n=1 Tax=Vespula pensylvanica TaxID=30213 RepID=A0A834UCS2_VESPE|nr:hypothetical protein H0235_004221 [Vespula pensylvanica]